MKLQNLWLLHNFKNFLLISKPSQIVVFIKINAYGLLKFALELKFIHLKKTISQNLWQKNRICVKCNESSFFFE